MSRELPSRYIIVDEGENRIVARTVGTHAILERLIDRLEERHGGQFFYDDDEAAKNYEPMVGRGLALFTGGW